MKEIKRGEVYYADVSPCVGSEQDGFRPVVIVQNGRGRIIGTVGSRRSQQKDNLIGIPAQKLARGILFFCLIFSWYASKRLIYAVSSLFRIIVVCEVNVRIFPPLAFPLRHTRKPSSSNTVLIFSIRMPSGKEISLTGLLRISLRLRTAYSWDP